MGDRTAIAWTDKTFNPWLGCVKVSEGCKNCYAERIVKTTMAKPKLWGPAKTTHRERTSAHYWHQPIMWNRSAMKRGIPSKVFAASLADVFEDHPDANALRPDLFKLIDETPWLHWQLLTKRPENILGMLPADWGTEGRPNVWLGTSVEDMRVAHRVATLIAIPAVVRFISYEPALGSLEQLDLTGLDWVIYGGESGPNFRPHNLAWPRVMRRKCDDLGIAFFYKQSAAPRTEMGIELDGEIVRNFPTPRISHDVPSSQSLSLL